jgi:hypothetical protein
MPRKLLLLYLCLAALFTGTSHAAQPDYKYDVLASSNTKISGLSLGIINSVAMNDMDTVVFSARYNDGSYAGAQGVFTRNRVLLKNGDTVRGLTVANPFVCGVNNFDELALTFTYPPFGGTAIGKFVRNGDQIVPEGKLVKKGDAIDGLTIQLLRECAINDMGEIAFAADYVDTSGNTGTGVFTRNRVIVKGTSVIDGIPMSGNNTVGHLYGLSDTGTLTFDTVGSLPNLGGSLTGAFTQHKLLAGPGETIDGIHLLTAYAPHISHFDRKVFTGLYNIDPSCYTYGCLGTAVFAHNSVIAKTGDTISGITLTDAFAEGINDEGTVLLQGIFNNGNGYGLFTKDSVIVLTTDTIGGFPVGGISASAINDFGSVVFITSNSLVLAKPTHHHGK